MPIIFIWSNYKLSITAYTSQFNHLPQNESYGRKTYSCLFSLSTICLTLRQTIKLTFWHFFDRLPFNKSTLLEFFVLMFFTHVSREWSDTSSLFVYDLKINIFKLILLFLCFVDIQFEWKYFANKMSLLSINFWVQKSILHFFRFFRFFAGPPKSDTSDWAWGPSEAWRTLSGLRPTTTVHTLHLSICIAKKSVFWGILYPIDCVKISFQNLLTAK